MYYKLIFTYEIEEESRRFVTCVQAFSEEGLNEVIQDVVKDQNFPLNYAVKIEKTSLKKLAEEERSRVLDELEDKYLALKYGSDIFNSEEYTRLKFKQPKDYFSLRNSYGDLRKYLCACRKIKKTVDTANITVAEFDKLVLESICSDVDQANGKYIN
ncbi:MAG: hypothetical protein HFE36_00035 [Clostridia bacterium]|nr:hypothetical protein [Clostridia bacterium]